MVELIPAILFRMPWFVGWVPRIAAAQCPEPVSLGIDVR